MNTLTAASMLHALRLSLSILASLVFLIVTAEARDFGTVKSDLNLALEKDDNSKSAVLAEELLQIANSGGTLSQQLEAVLLLARVHVRQKKYDKAAQLYSQALERASSTFGAESYEVADILDQFAIVYQLQDQHEKAADFVQRSLAIRSKEFRISGRCSLKKESAASSPKVDCDGEPVILASAGGNQILDEHVDAVPVFFGTDRGLVLKTLPGNQTRISYGSNRGRQLRLGLATVTIPKDHQIANIERPWAVSVFGVQFYREDENPKSHFVIHKIDEMTKEQFKAKMIERLANSKRFKNQAFIFVHGFNVGFEDALFRTAQIAYDLKFDGVPLLYTWPSKGKVSGYNSDENAAEQSERYLYEFLETVKSTTGVSSIHLIAHSMGNRPLLRVLEKISRHATTADGQRFGQVILAAPDIDRDVFEQLTEKIVSGTQGATLYVSRNDRAIGVSRLWNGAVRAGDAPAVGPVVLQNLDTIDMSAVSADIFSLNHSYYADSAWLVNDIASVFLNGTRPPDARTPILRKVTSKLGVYWMFPP